MPVSYTHLHADAPLTKGVAKNADNLETSRESAFGDVYKRQVENVRHLGRTVFILASRNLDAIAGQIESLPGATMERFPVGLVRG